MADFGDSAALERACAGAECIYLVTPAHPEMRRWKANAIEAAKGADVQHVVLATGLGASPKARLTFGMWHSETQELLKASGLVWTFVQPTYFMQNLLWQAATSSTTASVTTSWSARSPGSTRDIADVAAEALTGEGHEGKTYGLTGPETLTGDEIAALLTEATGHTVTSTPPCPLIRPRRV